MKLHELKDSTQPEKDVCALVKQDDQSLGAAILDMNKYKKNRQRAADAAFERKNEMQLPRERLPKDILVVVNESGQAEYMRRLPDGHLGSLGGE